MAYLRSEQSHISFHYFLLLIFFLRYHNAYAFVVNKDVYVSQFLTNVQHVEYDFQLLLQRGSREICSLFSV